MGDYSHLDCMRPGKTLSGEVSSPDSEPCIDQYRTVGSLIAGHNCSQGSAQGRGDSRQTPRKLSWPYQRDSRSFGPARPDGRTFAGYGNRSLNTCFACWRAPVSRMIMPCAKKVRLTDSSGDRAARGSARHEGCISIIILNLADNHPHNGRLSLPQKRRTRTLQFCQAISQLQGSNHPPSRVRHQAPGFQGHQISTHASFVNCGLLVVRTRLRFRHINIVAMEIAKRAVYRRTPPSKGSLEIRFAVTVSR